MAGQEHDLETVERTVRGLDKTAPKPPADIGELARTARRLVTDGRGILAADESHGTAAKRLDAIGMEANPETRRRYRQMLLTTPDLGEHISGTILYDETVRQTDDDGTPFAEVLDNQDIIAGLKADTGTIPLAGHPGEKVSSGLDGLRDRVAEYVELGARFAKWRSTYNIGRAIPSRACIEANAHVLARYASTCQEGGLVPIVEPEVLMDGDHSMEVDGEVTEAVLRALYEQLVRQDVVLEATLLKTNMVLPGENSGQNPSPEEVAEATITCLNRSVPAAVPGVVFLSGGQEAVDATERLNAMNQTGPQAWKLSFSYGRALQGPALEAWRGDPDNVEQAQARLAHRARCNGAATTGTYKSEMEQAA